MLTFKSFPGTSKLPVVIVTEQKQEPQGTSSQAPSTSKHFTSTEIKEKADTLLNSIFGHKKYKTAIQKQAVYAVAKSTAFLPFLNDTLV